MNLVKLDAVKTINSLEFRTMINSFRDASGEAKMRNDQFVARIEDEIDDLGVCKIIAHPQNGSDIKTYDLTIDQAMLIGMRESKAVRRAVLAQLKAMHSPVISIPSTLSGALMLAAKQAEQIEEQQAQLALAAPKVAFVQNYVAATTGSKGFREICKLLSVKENAFSDFLIEQGIMYRLGGVLSPAAPHLNAGRFEVKTGVNTTTGHAFNHALFTPKGVEWIAGVWARHCVKQACGVARDES